MLSAATGTGSPGEANVAAVPVADGEPVQSAVGYSRTVDPASAVPRMTGFRSELGGAGVTPVSVTSPGATESLV